MVAISPDALCIRLLLIRAGVGSEL
jgi:hypothetical protein